MRLPDHQLDEISEILVGPAQSRSDALSDEELAERLPGIIERRTAQDEAISIALEGSIVRAFLQLTRSDPQRIVDALYPVMLPAIRLAVRQSVQSALSSVNAAAAASISPSAIRWRIESVRTGRSVGDIALAESLVWRVRRAFVLHRDTALVIGHVAHPTVEQTDPDQVAAMLDAMSSFAAESFGMDSTTTGIGTLEVGGLQVWVERAPRFLGALVIEGHPPATLREDLQSWLAELHSDYTTLPDAPWMSGRDVLPPQREQTLQGLLQVHTDPPTPSRLPGYLLVATLSLLFVALVAGWTWDGRRTRHAAAELDALPGVVLADLDRHWLGWSSAWVVSPDIPSFEAAVNERGWPSWWHRLTIHTSPSDEPAQLLERIQRVLPDGVAIDPNGLDAGRIRYTGRTDSAGHAVLATTGLLPGVRSVDLSAVHHTEALDALTRWSILVTFDFEVVDPQNEAALRDELSRVATWAEQAGVDGRIHAAIGVDVRGSREANRSYAERRRARVSTLVAQTGLSMTGTILDTPDPTLGRNIRLDFRVESPDVDTDSVGSP